MLLQRAVESSQGGRELSSGQVAEKLREYAELLAAQGCALTALNYLGSSTDVS